MNAVTEWGFSGCNSPQRNRNSVCPAVLLLVLVLSSGREPCPEEGGGDPQCSPQLPDICFSESEGAVAFQPPGSSGCSKCGRWDPEGEESSEIYNGR